MKTLQDYERANGPFYMQKAQAQYFVGRIALDEISVMYKNDKETYQKFAEQYILKNGDFDAAVASFAILWMPNELAEFERAMSCFARESGLYKYVEER